MRQGRSKAGRGKREGGITKSYSEVLLSFMKINRLSEMTTNVERCKSIKMCVPKSRFLFPHADTWLLFPHA
jgi:hypothetical protein